MFSSAAKSDGISFEFDGFREFEKILVKLSGREINGVLRAAFDRATERIKAALQVAAPDAPGRPRGKRIHGQDLKFDLKRSIASEVKATGRGRVEVEVRGNYYGRILEYGWLPGKRPKGRNARALRIALAPQAAFVSPKPWIVPAFAAEEQKLIAEILNDLQKEVMQILEKYAAKGLG